MISIVNHFELCGYKEKLQEVVCPHEDLPEGTLQCPTMLPVSRPAPHMAQCVYW